MGLLTFLSFIGAARTFAAPVTVNASGLITTFVGPSQELFGTAELGAPLNLSFTYDGSMTPVQSLPGFDIYIPPLGSVTAHASLGDFDFEGPVNFQMDIFFGITWEVGGRKIYGDAAYFVAATGPYNSPTPPEFMSAELMFPVGTLSHSVILPDLQPSWTFVNFYRHLPDGTVGGGESLGEIGRGISPIPEPATYGVFASLLLVGVAAFRRRKSMRAECSVVLSGGSPRNVVSSRKYLSGGSGSSLWGA